LNPRSSSCAKRLPTSSNPPLQPRSAANSSPNIPSHNESPLMTPRTQSPQVSESAYCAFLKKIRLPGFANKKYESDFYVKAHAESAQEYHLRDFKLEIDSQDCGFRKLICIQSMRSSMPPALISCSILTSSALVFRSWKFNPQKVSLGVRSSTATLGAAPSLEGRVPTIRA